MGAFSGFYKKTIQERIELLKQERGINDGEAKVLLDSGALDLETANRMIENLVGVNHLPLGIAPGFRINGKEYAVPMCIEEPSVIAAAAKAAKLAAQSGGFTADADEPVMTGQVQLVNVPEDVLEKFNANKGEIAARAKELASGMEMYGGGYRECEAHTLETSRGRMLVAVFYVDVRDAMGANTLNTLLEGIAPLLEEKVAGEARLRILTNLAVRRKARAKCTWKKEVVGEDAIEGILDGYELAVNDIYRCCTHNKGIMNGVDAVAVATGNDWRAVEASAHAYAAMDGYTPLNKFYKNEDGDLVGEIELPLAVGTVGGAINTSPTAGIALKLLGAESAMELSMVMAAVGLAQNFAALYALGTEGIQKGHMKLHASNLAAGAGAKEGEIEKVAKKMQEQNEYSVESAKNILKKLRGE
ncbi:hydroxymethylglutaryl-CoA reductase, degradative [Candidatus Micrarchaeota archaeon]|nr:hydroxymethylglutaryl-CoA reductase, degradative [Candidatus Micrarchaeota archaeon]